MAIPSLRERVLELLRKSDYQPLDKVDLSRKLDMHSSERRKLREVLRALEDEGAIVRTSKGRFLLPEIADMAAGTLQVHGGGNAHLLSETKGVKDIFVPAAHLGTAMHGDKVIGRSRVVNVTLGVAVMITQRNLPLALACAWITPLSLMPPE